ncbi:hypothetical protein [Roseibium aggregatum]|uniref:DUF2946 domain-containing protein n=1 Tax=Roseibium aggregatum TaxID=187304 RepID=A0A926P6L5_9HYPH|nr:hypothetical protein [Roseibium aggregatum]MBD1549002.1 hypothetical protein [Roseibium aggregatum]
MAIGNTSGISRQTTAWRRMSGVCVCLLALAMLAFGHLDPPSMPMSHGGYAVTASAAHSDSHMPTSHMPREHAATPGHCMHHGNCAFHGVVPVVFTLMPPAASAQLLVDERAGLPRVISPLQHPPKMLGA